MKRAVWIVCAVVAVAWTLGAVLTAELVGWAAEALGSGGAADLGRALLGSPVPAWLSVWADPAWIEAGRVVQSQAAPTGKRGRPAFVYRPTTEAVEPDTDTGTSVGG